jgi:hypothetical protein
LLPEEQFGLYAVSARFPQGLAGRVPWQVVGPGVYDCRWGTDVVRVVVAGELAREPHNAPLHLFSARPELVGYGGRAYGRHSGETSLLLLQLFKGFQAEGIGMPYTMEDFKRDYTIRHFGQLTPEERVEALQALPPEERQEMLRALPPEERLAGLSAEDIRQYLDRLTRGQAGSARKPRRKK